MGILGSNWFAKDNERVRPYGYVSLVKQRPQSYQCMHTSNNGNIELSKTKITILERKTHTKNKLLVDKMQPIQIGSKSHRFCVFEL